MGGKLWQNFLKAKFCIQGNVRKGEQGLINGGSIQYDYGGVVDALPPPYIRGKLWPIFLEAKIPSVRILCGENEGAHQREFNHYSGIENLNVA